MPSSFLKIIIGVFVALLLVVLALNLSERLTGTPSSIPPSDAASIKLDSFTDASVDRIAIGRKGADDVVLERSEGGWRVGSDPADPAKVASIFRAFSGLEVLAMASKSEQSFGAFGVTKEDGIRLAVRGKDGKESVFYAGKPGGIPMEFAFRKDGIKNTYSVRGELRTLLEKEASFWKPSEEKNDGDPKQSSSRQSPQKPKE